MVALQGMKLTDQISVYSYYGQAVAAQSLAYPFISVQRRLESVTGSRHLSVRGLSSDSQTSAVKIFR